MARKPRVDLGGFTYHVTQRGNNRDACFFAEADYRFYLDCIKQAECLKKYKLDPQVPDHHSSVNTHNHGVCRV